tara:strand:+ start:9333 stop:12317 length:2985 start_codon:yes stop_codon:yes gene_type:complete
MVARVPSVQGVTAADVAVQQTRLPQGGSVEGLDAAARATVAGGQAGSKFAQDLATIGTRVQHDDEARAYRTAESAIEKSLFDAEYDPAKGWRKDKGQTLVDNFTDHEDAIKDSITNETNKVTNAKVLEALKIRGQELGLQARARLTLKSITEREVANEQADQVAIAQGSNSYAADVISAVQSGVNVGVAMNSEISRGYVDRVTERLLASAERKYGDFFEGTPAEQEKAKRTFVLTALTGMHEAVIVALRADDRGGDALHYFQSAVARGEVAATEQGRIAATVRAATGADLAFAAAKLAEEAFPDDETKQLRYIEDNFSGKVRTDALIRVRQNNEDALATELNILEAAKRVEAYEVMTEAAANRDRPTIASDAAVRAMKGNENDPTAAATALRARTDLSAKDIEAGLEILANMRVEYGLTQAQKVLSARQQEAFDGIADNLARRERPDKAEKAVTLAIKKTRRADGSIDATAAFEHIRSRANLTAEDEDAAAALLTTMLSEALATPNAELAERRMADTLAQITANEDRRERPEQARALATQSLKTANFDETAAAALIEEAEVSAETKSDAQKELKNRVAEANATRAKSVEDIRIEEALAQIVANEELRAQPAQARLLASQALKTSNYNETEAARVIEDSNASAKVKAAAQVELKNRVAEAFATEDRRLKAEALDRTIEANERDIQASIRAEQNAVAAKKERERKAKLRTDRMAANKLLMSGKATLSTLSDDQHDALAQTLGGLSNAKLIQERVARGAVQVSDHKIFIRLHDQFRNDPVAYSDIDFSDPKWISGFKDEETGEMMTGMTIGELDESMARQLLLDKREVAELRRQEEAVDKAARRTHAMSIAAPMLKGLNLSDGQLGEFSEALGAVLDQRKQEGVVLKNADISGIIRGLLIQGETMGWSSPVIDPTVRLFSAFLKGKVFDVEGFTRVNKETFQVIGQEAGIFGNQPLVDNIIAGLIQRRVLPSPRKVREIFDLIPEEKRGRARATPRE